MTRGAVESGAEPRVESAGLPVDAANGIPVRVAVRVVVATVAVEELPLIDGLATFDDATIVRRLKRRRRRPDRLGFGINEIETLVTLVAWQAFNQIVKRLTDAAADKSTKGAKALLRRLFRRNRPSATVPVLTEAQRDEVRQVARTVAVERGLAPERADAFADALADTLIPKRTEPDPDGAEQG